MKIDWESKMLLVKIIFGIAFIALFFWALFTPTDPMFGTKFNGKSYDRTEMFHLTDIEPNGRQFCADLKNGTDTSITYCSGDKKTYSIWNVGDTYKAYEKKDSDGITYQQIFFELQKNKKVIKF